MAFQFPNTPHDGIPFDRGSEQEIQNHQTTARFINCNGCISDVEVNIDNIVPTSEVIPMSMSKAGPRESRFVAIFNTTIVEDTTGYVVECPVCRMVSPTAQIDD